MCMPSTQRSRVIGVSLLFGVVACVTEPAWAGERLAAMSESERTARIQELQRDRTNVESELRRIRSQPEGTSRSTAPGSEFTDQPTRSMKESLESLSGVSARQDAAGRDVTLSIRGSK
jgi:hypothetical protein